MKTMKCRRAVRAAMSHGCTTRFGLVACIAAMMLCCSALGQFEDLYGRWDKPVKCLPGDTDYEWEEQAYNAIHLPSNDVLFWRFPGSSSNVWSAANGCTTPVTTSYQLGCSAHVGLSNGSILVAGGRLGAHQNTGIDQVLIYRLGGGTFGGPWDLVEPMNHARWYPTLTALPDGTVLAISGKDEYSALVDIPEIYDPGADEWVDMADGAAKFLPVYPFMFVLPYGSNVFYAGSVGGGFYNDGKTYILDLEEQVTAWGPAILSIPTSFGGAVMYEPGKVLRCGGDDLDAELLTPVTQMIDLSDPASPLPASWDTDPFWNMKTARRWHNLVLLADGTILAIGGEDDAGAVKEAELFDPNDPIALQWRLMAAMEKERKEHSTALLMLDGRVLAAGAPLDPFPTAEIYSPAYLFDANGLAPRPLIGYAPTDVPYGADFSVILSGASPVQVQAIDKVSFVRLGSTTHGFDMDQRYVRLDFVVIDTVTLEVQAPANGNLAPPGYYMLFLISDDGVPSIAKYVRLFGPSST